MQLTGHGGIGGHGGAEWTSKTFAFGGAVANEPVTLEFDLAFSNGWETSGEFQDFFEVRINGQVASDVSAGPNLSYRGTTDGSGDVTVTFRSITTANGESALIDNLSISLDSPPTSNELFLYGDDNDAEQFVIHSEEDVTLVNFDTISDVLDLSEVITDSDGDVDSNGLAEYLNFVQGDFDDDGIIDDTQITIDHDGESDPGTDTTVVTIQDETLNETDIDDLNIDYQNN